jgi:DNA integrity scanning protein DisA with diadenylate cyclase activity
MNLTFQTKDGVGRVEFPFQTPTSLTYAVLKKETNEERLLLIGQYLKEQDWSESDIQETLEEIQRLMESPHLELSLI